MSRSRTSLATTLVMASVAAATTWISMLSWRGFTEDSTTFLRPLLVLAVVVAGIGAAGRWYRLPAVAVVATQALVSALVATWLLVGTPLPVGASGTELVRLFRDGVASANQYAPPVPDHVPGIHPLLVAGGLGCLLLVDLLACTLRRVPLAGLPLLTVYSVPIGILGGGLSWWVFALTAAGFLTLLFLHESEQVARWGRSIGHDPTVTDPQAFAVQAGASRATAGAVGGVATALAIVVPLAIPTLDVHLFDFGPGAGDDEIKLENPMVDLRRDLKREVDVPLVRVRTDDPRPEYLRISVLNRFAENEWSSGDRAIPTEQIADGPMPPLEGVDGTVPRVEHRYDISVSEAFDSDWLPTQAPVSAITAEGDWRYDTATMDFIAGDDDLSAAGASYSLKAVELQPDPVSMVRAAPSAALVSQEFIDLPSPMPPLVRELATSVTANAATPFEKAVSLQNWFREDGGFTYSLDAEAGSGTDDLVEFLSEGQGGRVGYCEQFAAAMAVMARTLNIPARVAVGFLAPERVGRDTWEYSAYDLHSWPELFIAGSGWVRFEPTPPDRANDVPEYTQVDIGDIPALPSATSQPSNADEVDRGGSASPAPSPSAAKPSATADAEDGESSVLLLAVLGGLAALLALGALACVPRTVRRSRRSRRLAGDAELVWLELRDTADDLGVPWPRDRSPRETRAVLVEHLGAPLTADTPDRPAHGPDLAPDAVRALDRLVGALELSRYSDRGASAGDLRADGAACVAALEAGATPSRRRRAEWWPRSVFRRGARMPERRGPGGPGDRGTTMSGAVVDHVG